MSYPENWPSCIKCGAKRDEPCKTSEGETIDSPHFYRTKPEQAGTEYDLDHTHPDGFVCVNDEAAPEDGRSCPICHETVTSTERNTEMLEYADGVGQPNDPRRIPADRGRMVPGPTVTTFQPCGHRLA